MVYDGTTASGQAAVTGAVVMADISGSTPLYENQGNDAAATAINARITRMRETVDKYRGTFVSAKGDDVLCWFVDADSALDAAYEMAAMQDPSGLTVHAGVQWGQFIRHEGDIFGGCVNTAARLCSLAKSGEILLGADLFAMLADDKRKPLTEMSPVRLKGLDAEMRIFSRQVEKPGGARTVMLDADAFRAALQQLEAKFYFDGVEQSLDVGQKLDVGRSEDNDMVVPAMSVSRQHATIIVNNGLVEFSDHSSAGSYVRMANGEELSVFRRSVVLTGNGTIALGAPHQGGDQPLIHFQIVTTSRG